MKKENGGKLLESFRNMFLDLVSMGKGFVYGFVMVGLLIVVCSVLIYGFIILKNILF